MRAGCILAFEFLHAKKIGCLDTKPENVLLDAGGPAAAVRLRVRAKDGVGAAVRFAAASRCAARPASTWRPRSSPRSATAPPRLVGARHDLLRRWSLACRPWFAPGQNRDREAEFSRIQFAPLAMPRRHHADLRGDAPAAARPRPIRPNTIPIGAIRAARPTCANDPNLPPRRLGRGRGRRAPPAARAPGARPASPSSSTRPRRRRSVSSPFIACPAGRGRRARPAHARRARIRRSSAASSRASTCG